jgi:hypothetical protein
MTTKQRRKNRLPPFTAMTKATMATPAWRAMSLGARMYYIEMRGRLRNDYANNGRVFLSCRTAARAIGAGRNSIARWAAENEHYGFLRKTSEGFLGVNGRGVAPHYRLTEFSCGTEPATRDFEKWDGELFLHTRLRGWQKKQNPVTTNGTPRHYQWDITKPPEADPLCHHQWDIGKPRRCHHQRDVTRKASPQRKRSLIQGSSMARAPVKAGDAGSSPAPVARPDLLRGPDGELTTMVLNIVHAQLDELEQRPAPRRAAYSRCAKAG